jgi:hypothetical protein
MAAKVYQLAKVGYLLFVCLAFAQKLTNELQFKFIAPATFAKLLLCVRVF